MSKTAELEVFVEPMVTATDTQKNVLLTVGVVSGLLEIKPRLRQTLEV